MNSPIVLHKSYSPIALKSIAKQNKKVTRNAACCYNRNDWSTLASSWKFQSFQRRV